MSHGIREYDIGDSVRCSVEFKDPSTGGFIDPTTVSISVKTPSGAVTTKVYPDPAVVKTAVGKYYIDVDATAAGTWHYRWFSTGTGKGAEERSFVVKRSKVL